MELTYVVLNKSKNQVSTIQLNWILWVGTYQGTRMLYVFVDVDLVKLYLIGGNLFYGMFVHIVLINAIIEWNIVDEKGKNVTEEKSQWKKSRAWELLFFLTLIFERTWKSEPCALTWLIKRQNSNTKQRSRSGMLLDLCFLITSIKHSLSLSNILISRAALHKGWEQNTSCLPS